MSKNLTTSEVAEKCGVENQVVRRWCREGRFPNAHQLPVKTGNGKVWLIPESDLKNFEPPLQGRPLSKNPSAAALKKRASRAEKKRSI